MAKRQQKRQRLIGSWNNGLILSVIIHVIILTFLGLFYFDAKNIEKNIVLKLSFTSITEDDIVKINNNSILTDTDAEDDETDQEFVRQDIVNFVSNTEQSTIEINEPVIDIYNNIDIGISPINSTNLMQEIGGSTNTESPTDTALNRFNRLLKAGTTIADYMPQGTAIGTNVQFENKLGIYGAKTGDIQISLSWNTEDDIDLHVDHSFNNNVESISWHNPMGRLGGMLDIDMNAGILRNANPIENVFWPTNTNPVGKFRIGVHFFRSWTGARSVPVVIRIKTIKGISYYDSVVHLGRPAQVITEFDF